MACGVNCRCDKCNDRISTVDNWRYTIQLRISQGSWHAKSEAIVCVLRKLSNLAINVGVKITVHLMSRYNYTLVTL